MGDPKYLVSPDPRRTKIVEQAATGIDNALVTFGSDPFNSSSYVGLRVPLLPTSTPNNRYLFLLASFAVPEGQRARILGYRQLLTIGIETDDVISPQSPSTNIYSIEQQVVSPFWRFQDANVSWHIHRLGPPNSQGIPSVFPAPVPPGGGTLDRPNMKFLFAQGPALLYQTFTTPDAGYLNLSSYTPPNLGRPWGTPLTAGSQCTFYDIRTNATSPNAWTSLNVEVEGPETVAFFASVRQTNPETRVQLIPPANFFTLDQPEEKFLSVFSTQNPFTGPSYWRVGGSLITEFI